MYATDSGFPAQNSSNEARINVRISRNRRTPRFNQEAYSERVEEIAEVGSQVIDLNANDGDQVG